MKHDNYRLTSAGVGSWKQYDGYLERFRQPACCKSQIKVQGIQGSEAGKINKREEGMQFEDSACA